jgi:hypothetical protein
MRLGIRSGLRLLLFSIIDNSAEDALVFYNNVN